MTQFFDYINSILNLVKDLISSVIDFIPSIFNFFSEGIDILPTEIKIVFLGGFSLCMGILIYRFIR